MARSPVFWLLLLGVALGGFFDGILLHQILQWHHLLSLVPGAGDLRMQVLWEGYFHALMYVLASLGLWGLSRIRHQLAILPLQRLLGILAMGFGLWHFADGILSHWLLGIHRVRLDSATPLAWGLDWFTGLGVLPFLIGALLSRYGGGGVHPRSVIAMLALLMTVAGVWAIQPPPGQPFTTVVFAGSGEDRVKAVLSELDADLQLGTRIIASFSALVAAPKQPSDIPAVAVPKKIFA